MRLILLLSFLLSGFLVTVSDFAPDYEYESDEDTLYENDDLPIENPAVPVSTDNVRPSLKYKDILKDEEEAPESEGNDVLDYKDYEEDGVVSNAVKSAIEESNFDRSDLEDDYENFIKYQYRQGYPVKNYFKRQRRSVPLVIKPRKLNVQHPRGMYFPHNQSFNKGYRETACNQGYRRDARGRCRKILR